MVELHVSGDRAHLLVQNLPGEIDKAHKPGIAIDQEVAVAAPDMPDVVSQEGYDMRLVHQGDTVA